MPAEIEWLSPLIFMKSDVPCHFCVRRIQDVSFEASFHGVMPFHAAAPHPIEAVVFALKSPLNKCDLLTDELGLGKTIKAGIVLCQYQAERKHQLPEIGPASLRKQWAMKLEDKFNLLLGARASDGMSAPAGGQRACWVPKKGESCLEMSRLAFALRITQSKRDKPLNFAACSA
jgi:SNF2 family DNA or RNA helicase